MRTTSVSTSSHFSDLFLPIHGTPTPPFGDNLKYHSAIIDEGAGVLIELRLKMKELEAYAKKRHSTNYAEQSVIEMLHKLMVAAKKRQDTAY